MSNHVTIKDAVKRYGDFTALNGVSLDINEGEFFTLLGPSGCGKTTLLRMIAGFNSIESGEFYFGDKLINNIPAHKRDIGMVFQNYAIFPHLTVKENVAYGLKARKVPKDQMDAKVKEALELVQISHLADRKPNELSGGQQQRVALARAVVIEPSVLLFDEPLSNLDAKLRERMRDELRALQKRLGITSLYVTHDQAEAMAISDKVVIMKDGDLVQVGSPRDVYAYPKTKFVAHFIGKANFISALYEKGSADGADVKLGDRHIHVPAPGLVKLAPGERCCLMFRPESGRLSPDGEGLPARITRATYFGSNIEYQMMLGDTAITVETFNPRQETTFAEGDEVKVQLDLASVRVLADDMEIKDE